MGRHEGRQRRHLSDRFRLRPFDGMSFDRPRPRLDGRAELLRHHHHFEKAVLKQAVEGVGGHLLDRPAVATILGQRRHHRSEGHAVGGGEEVEPAYVILDPTFHLVKERRQRRRHLAPDLFKDRLPALSPRLVAGGEESPPLAAIDGREGHHLLARRPPDHQFRRRRAADGTAPVEQAHAEHHQQQRHPQRRQTAPHPRPPSRRRLRRLDPGLVTDALVKTRGRPHRAALVQGPPLGCPMAQNRFIASQPGHAASKLSWSRHICLPSGVISFLRHPRGRGGSGPRAPKHGVCGPGCPRSRLTVVTGGGWSSQRNLALEWKIRIAGQVPRAANLPFADVSGRIPA